MGKKSMSLQAEISETPRSIVLRSLRRRLWHAFSCDDASTALRAYQATLVDWERWCLQEAADQESQRRNAEQNRPRFLPRLGKKPTTSRSSSTTSDSQTLASTNVVKAASTDDSLKNSNKKDVGLLQRSINPTEPFLLDDYYRPNDSFDMPVDDKIPCSTSLKATKPKGARQAFSLFKRQNSFEPNLDGNHATPAVATTVWEHPDRTTPLHEAARLGCALLVRLMLAHPDVDVNARNGAQRTALHMVAGGCLNAENVSQLFIPPPTSLLVPEDRSRNHNAARVLGRFLRESLSLHPQKTDDSSQAPLSRSNSRWKPQQADRTDTTLALLSWSYPDENGTDRHGPSTNSVDVAGRTALHYAAALGRSDICMAVLSSFGSLLTIVDDQGRTPCEWAAEYKHDKLAAQLEARAVLYMDPYGMDEELLTDLNESDGFSRSSLVPPFSWFTTLTHVQAERERRIDQTLRGMKAILVEKQHKGTSSVDSQQAEEEEERKQPSLPIDPPADKEETATSSVDAEQEDDDKPPSLPVDPADYKQNQVTKTVQSLVDPDPSSENEAKLQKKEQIKHELSDKDRECVLSDKDAKERQSEDESIGRPDPLDGGLDKDGKEVSLPAQLKKGDDYLLDGNENIENEQSTPQSQPLDSIHKAHVEILLSFHHWDVEKVLLAFEENFLDAFRDAGLSLPSQQKSQEELASQEVVCLICCDMFDPRSSHWRSLSSCEHSFCTECLGDYLAEAAESRTTGLSILCPHHECNAPLSPMEIVELTRTSDEYGALLNTANDNFVVSANDLKFCPHPGCSGIVKFRILNKNITNFLERAGLTSELLQIVGAVCTATGSQGHHVPLTYEGVGDPVYYRSFSEVEPKIAHRFCFQCGELGIHWPVSCQTLAEWNDAVKAQVGELVDGDDQKYADVAQKLWMKANTRPCPKCQAPIEKHEGCNHMTCSACSHEFCWICRNDWRLHNTETGGFFRCNRWVDQKDHEFYDTSLPDPSVVALTPEDLSDPSTMEVTYGTAMHEARVAGSRAREMGRFLHHYRRFNGHKESAALEKQMSATAFQRLAPVVEAAVELLGEDVFGGRGLSFVHAAFSELLECRSILQHSYAFSFIRYQSSSERKYKLRKMRASEKVLFEQHQGDLEMVTEQISDVVARAHLRATQTQIRHLTAAAAEKRNQFSELVIRILVDEQRQKNKSSDTEDGIVKKERESKRKLPSSIMESIFGLAGESQSDSETADLEYRMSVEQDEVDAAILASLRDVTSDNSQDASGEWACSACTYLNSGGRRCAMCGTDRS